MSDKRIGKPAPGQLDRLIAGNLGHPSEHLILPPGAGLDAAILELDDHRVMAVAEDPIFPAPGLPLEIMGRFTVHIGASDVAVTGVAPQYLSYTLLLPGGCPEDDARTIIESISRTADELGIAIVGGHTGWYDAVTVPTVGGVTVWGFAPSDGWISPGGAQGGDVILMTKGPSIEAAALLAVVYRDRLAGQVDDTLLEHAIARTDEITVVEDALSAARVGGVHAMHDATEGGVLGGLWEMARAAGKGLEVTLDESMVPEDIAAVAHHLGFDPWCAISEGTLLAAVNPDRVEAVRAEWSGRGITSRVLGRFVAGSTTCTAVRDGRTETIDEPGEDPFWKLFFEGLKD